MNDSDHEPDLFTEALRADLPSEGDEARIRRRLVTAGVLAGASVVVPSTAAAAASGGGFLSKVASLPLALKVGASVVVVGVAGVPVFDVVSGSRDAAGSQGTQVALVAAPVPVRSPGGEQTANQPREVPPVVAQPEVQSGEPLDPGAEQAEPPSSERALVRAAAEPSRAPALPRPTAKVSAPLPAVGSFPAAETAAVDEGTLRAETALMERALAALGRDDLATARRELAAHAARFPNGHLKRERERALERTLGKETER